MPLGDRGLVVARSHEEPPIGPRLVEVGGGLDQGVQVAALPVLWPALGGIRPAIPLALHRAEEITPIQDAGVAVDRLLEVERLEAVVGVCVVVVGVRPEQEVLRPAGRGGVQVDPVAPRGGLLDPPVGHRYLPFFRRSVRSLGEPLPERLESLGEVPPLLEAGVVARLFLEGHTLLVARPAEEETAEAGQDRGDRRSAR